MEGLLALVAAVLTAASVASRGAAYTNYTVGDTAGWFFNAATNRSAADYQAWAKKFTFNLGDFLIFNTDSDHTVVQTYNGTAFKSCDYDDDSGSDTILYSVPGDPTKLGVRGVIAVPLTKVGDNYYFSDANDGIQCADGLKFSISVNKGEGLPPSLIEPPPSPPSSASSPPAADTPPIGTPSSQNENFANSAASRPLPAAGLAFPVILVCGLVALFV
ncbi:blue copper protein-like [Nymphaea colorata]|nr:blue copper protein-like [Nymphaea colorata]